MSEYMIGEDPNNEEQLGLISRADVYEVEDVDHLLALRTHLFRVAQNALDVAYEITDVLVGQEVESKSRRKRIRVIDL